MRMGKTPSGKARAGEIGMAAAVRALPLELREPLLIVVLAGFTHREAASALDISLATLITRLTKARERVAALTRPHAAAAPEGGSASARCEVMEAGRLADLHAYVDDCLEPDERLAFEQQMAQDPALARRAALWRAQNSAIRTAFDGEGARAFPISIVRHQNETFGRAARSGAAGAKPSGEQLPRATLSAVARDQATFSEGPRARRVSAVALMAAGARGVVGLPCLRLGSGRDRRPRRTPWGSRRCGFPGLRPPGG